MLEKIKQKITAIKQGKPGERFQQQHARRRKRPPILYDILSITAGVFLVLAGIVLSLVPGLPGIALAFLGMAMLAFRFRLVSVILDKVELTLRAIARRLTGKKK